MGCASRYFAMANLSGPTCAALYQLKLLTTAFFTVTFLKRQLSATKVGSRRLRGCACTTSVLTPHFSGCGSLFCFVVQRVCKSALVTVLLNRTQRP